MVGLGWSGVGGWVRVGWGWWLVRLVWGWWLGYGGLGLVVGLGWDEDGIHGSLFNPNWGTAGLCILFNRPHIAFIHYYW